MKTTEHRDMTNVELMLRMARLALFLFFAWSYHPRQHAGWANIFEWVLWSILAVLLIVNWLDRRYGNRGTR